MRKRKAWALRPGFGPWLVGRSVTGRWWYARKPKSSPPQVLRARTLDALREEINLGPLWRRLPGLDIPGTT